MEEAIDAAVDDFVHDVAQMLNVANEEARGAIADRLNFD